MPDAAGAAITAEVTVRGAPADAIALVASAGIITGVYGAAAWVLARRQDAERRRNAERRSERARTLSRLTPRERQGLAAVVDGQPNRQIAAGLGISPRTVEVYKARMMERLQARSLADVIRIVLGNPAGPA